MITEIKFKNIVIEDLGHFNLFVGKTQLLEDFIEETKWFTSCLINYMEVNSINKKLYHYTHFDRLWSNWLEEKDQVIKVTQSVDVIKAFLKMAKEKNEKDIRLFRLEQSDNEIIVTKYNFEDLKIAVEEMNLDPR